MMKRIIVLLFVIFNISLISSSQNLTDSLVRYTDLKFHSPFEELSIHDFVNKSTDTFNLFLAIDENMNNDEAIAMYQNYESVFNILLKKKLDSKNPGKKIRTIYPAVHQYFLKKYSSDAYFPEVFMTGLYNCVTASVIYAMIFDYYKIPYKVMGSSDHAYLIANPGENSIVIETTNPDFELAIFNGDFKQNYVNYLRSSKQISEAEFKSKSTEEIFEEKFNEVKEVNFTNLNGFQYYNRALSEFENNNIEHAYELCQKAYFFYPDLQVKALLNTLLLFEIEKCNFNKVTDIDYIAQLARFDNIGTDAVVGIFGNIINYYLQYIDKQEYVESMFQRLIPQISDRSISDEISFSYFLTMSRKFFLTSKAEYYIANAIKIKSNHNDAITMLKAYLYDKFNRINEPEAMLDTLKRLEATYQYEQITPVITNFRRIAWLEMAEGFYKKDDPAQGNKFLTLFEENCKPPVDDQLVGRSIEMAYRSAAVYYYYKNQKAKARSYIEKGLQYSPGSVLLKSTVF